MHYAQNERPKKEATQLHRPFKYEYTMPIRMNSQTRKPCTYIGVHW